MKEERISCWTKVFPDGSLHLIPKRQVNLRPGDWAVYSANPPEVVIHRVGFGRRWFTIIRARIRGVESPKLVTSILQTRHNQDEQTRRDPQDPA